MISAPVTQPQDLELTSTHLSKLQMARVLWGILSVSIAVIISVASTGEAAADKQQFLLTPSAAPFDAVPAAAPFDAVPAAATTDAVLDTYFPQFRARCGIDSWKAEYQAMHHDIVTGRKPPYYLTSLAVVRGLADRITASVTMFYVAMLSGRAFTMTTHDGLPSFEAVCKKPYINWTHPFTYPEEATKLASDRNPYAPTEKYADKTYPATGPVNSSTYYSYFFLDLDPIPDNWQFHQLAHSDLTLFPVESHTVPYVLAVGNRGQTYHMMSNPYHRTKFWTFGLTPETAFMCGFFYLCSPNAAVVNSKAELWKTLSMPDTLRIGIAVRIGDHIFKQHHKQNRTTVMQQGMSMLETTAAKHFKCAEKLELKFARPDQRVIWYLISDSMALRQAAKAKYGDKILTDTVRDPMHVADPDCLRGDSYVPCNKGSLEAAMQHALGEMLSFSMADYHVYDGHSGFSRLGSWLSAKYKNAYVVQGAGGCVPGKPTTPEQSANTGAYV